ncbi:hypothetical protein HYZ64_03345 [Candidatus Berkelbacteria bacterium]|nr:hypothetical protein [Candidatus Berkelbacteria bacterium]
MTAQQLLDRMSKVKEFKVGKTPVVVLPLDDYDAIRESVEMYESKTYRKEIAKSREEVKKGQVISYENLKRKLGL